MDAVGLAGAIGGGVVGLGGVLASAWAVWTQRESARELAQSQQAHEMDMTRRGRLAQRRAPVYEEALRLLYVWMDRIDKTEPIIVFGKPDPVPNPPTEEEWLRMLARLRVNGSREVGDAYEKFQGAAVSFFGYVATVRLFRQQPAGGTPPVEKMQAARLAAREKLNALEQLMGEEMAEL